MGTTTDKKRRELIARLEDADHNCQSGVCNWCGASNDKLTKTRNVMVSDLSRTILRCESCDELTARYRWNGTQYRAAATTNNGQYHVIAGTQTA